MTTMNISLPDVMKAFVDQQIATGEYSSASEYVRSLLREAQKRSAQDKLVPLLLEGLDSGDSSPMTKQEWDALRREAMERLAANKPK